MFESNGTTPEPSQDSTTLPPAISGIPSKDTLIAQNVELTNKVEELQARMAGLVNELELMTARALRSEAIIDTARRAIEEVLAGDIDASTTFDEFREAFEELGVKATREVSIELSVTWRGTIELPLGVDVDDLDADDFGISIDGHHEYEGYINNYFEDYSIRER